MDKEKFVVWLEAKINELENDSTAPLEDKTQHAYMRGFIKSLDAVKKLVNEGRFDK